MKQTPSVTTINKPPAAASPTPKATEGHGKALAGKPTIAQLNDLIKEIESDALVDALDVSPWMKETFIPGLIRKALLGENLKELLDSFRIGDKPNTQISQEDAELIINKAKNEKYKDKLAELIKENEQKALAKNIPEVAKTEIPKVVPKKERPRPVPKSEVPGTPSVLPYEVKPASVKGQPVKKPEVIPHLKKDELEPKRVELQKLQQEISEKKEEKSIIHKFISKAKAEKNEKVLPQLYKSLGEINKKLTPMYKKRDELRALKKKSA